MLHNCNVITLVLYIMSRVRYKYVVINIYGVDVRAYITQIILCM